jgi:hypothetical protein
METITRNAAPSKISAAAKIRLTDFILQPTSKKGLACSANPFI